MSSETRKKACKSSVIQPSVTVSLNCCSLRGEGERMAAVSGTERPRLHLPPTVLYCRF